MDKVANPPPPDLTKMLHAWQAGDAIARDQLFEIVYPDLRRIAKLHLKRQGNLTCQPTEIVHEAYLKMHAAGTLDLENRLQFFGFAARVVRHLLVDRVRHKAASKRGGDVVTVCLDPQRLVEPAPDLDLLALHQAMDRLAEHDELAMRIVELRCFAGLTVPEVATLLDIGKATVSRRWQMSCAWLHRALHGENSTGDTSTLGRL